MDLNECISAYALIQPNKAEEFKKLGQLRGLFYTREEPLHATASAIIINESHTKVLFAYHNIYRSFAWLGGHNDGDTDFLQVAKKEALEETSLASVTLYSRIPVYVGTLPVKQHEKSGKRVNAHLHFTVCYCFVASEKAKTAPKTDENSAVEWLNVESLTSFVNEPAMHSVYRECLENIQKIRTLKEANFGSLAQKLLPWYAKSKRDLPWRKSKDAYRVWVSEIMLQQTRVEAAKDYYLRFIKRLPTVYDLAACPIDELYKLWEGLGYYNRVRNMQKAAKTVVEEHGGVFPSDLKALQTLAGIGAYTAGAVSSIAYEKPNPAIDGNVIRVLSRYTEDYKTVEENKTALYEPLKRVYPRENCGDFTQSLMELGATVCTPTSPKCSVCPLKQDCLADKLSVCELLPVQTEKKARKKQDITVFVLRCNDLIAIEKRSQRGVLSGLYQLINREGHLSEAEINALFAKNGVQSVEYLGAHTHVFTHLEWYMQAYLVSVCNLDGFNGYTLATIRDELSLPTAFKWCLKHIDN